MSILELFPILKVFVGEKSLSELQRIAEDNKNKNDRKLSKLNNYNLYTTIREFLTADGEVNQSNCEKGNITINDFDVLPSVADRNKENAIYRAVTKMVEDIRKQLSNYPTAKLATLLGQELPIFNKPRVNKINVCNSNKWQDAETIEGLLNDVNLELVKLNGDDIKKALEIEAMAAVYGNQVNTSKAFLLQLNKANSTIGEPEKTITDNYVLIETKVLAYDKDEFNPLFEELMKTYTEYQKQRNFYMAKFKNIIRDTQRNYDELYSNELQRINTLENEYRNNFNELSAKIEAIRTVLLKELSDLKFC